MPRFLISRLSSIGDVVCCLPVASSLKAGHPGCHITWVVDPRFKDVVECCTAVDEIVAARPGFSPSSWPRYDNEFDVAMDLQGLLKSALPVAKARAKIKLGYHWQREGSWMFCQKVLPDPSSIHVVDQYVDMARAAGGVGDRADFSLAPPKEAADSADGLLEEEGVASPFVAMNPSAGWRTKWWPVEHYAALSDLLDREGIATVLIGGPSQTDAALCESTRGAAKSAPKVLAGKTTLKETIALLKRAAAHVAGDTGSIHLSAALGRPSVGLFSPTRPERSCPYGQLSNCHFDPAGMDRILPESVFRTIQEAIA